MGGLRPGSIDVRQLPWIFIGYVSRLSPESDHSGLVGFQQGSHSDDLSAFSRLRCLATDATSGISSWG